MLANVSQPASVFYHSSSALPRNARSRSIHQPNCKSHRRSTVEDTVFVGVRNQPSSPPYIHSLPSLQLGVGLQTSVVVVDWAFSYTKVVVSIGYAQSLARSAYVQQAKGKAYKPMSIAVSWNDSHIGTTLAIEGLGDGGNERLLVHSDCFNVTSWRGRAGSGSEGALLDWTAWVDRAPLGQGGAVSIINKSEKGRTLCHGIGVYIVTAQAKMLVAIERYFMLSMKGLG